MDQHTAATEVTDLIVGHPVTDWPIDGTSLEMERANEAERVKREQKIKIDVPVSKVKIEEREHPKNEELYQPGGKDFILKGAKQCDEHQEMDARQPLSIKKMEEEESASVPTLETPLQYKRKREECGSRDNDYVSYSIKMNEEELDRMIDAPGCSLDANSEDELHYVKGDASAPCVLCPWIVVHCVDASGSWPNKGFFGALRNRFGAWVQTYYELAGQRGDLQLGDVHLLPLSSNPDRQTPQNICKPEPVEEHGTRDDDWPNQRWLALLVGQKRHDEEESWRSGVHDMDYEAIKRGLVKLRTAIHSMCGGTRVYIGTLSIFGLRPTVHSARIGTREQWSVIEGLFRQYIVQSGVDVWTYYYSKTDRQRAGNTLSEDERREDGGGTAGLETPDLLLKREESEKRNEADKPARKKTKSAFDELETVKLQL